MDPSNPLFKPRYIAALNVRMKKMIPAKSDYTKPEMRMKLQAIAATVLTDMGVKNYNVLIKFKPLKNHKVEMGILFQKVEPKLWTPPGMEKRNG